MALLSLFDGTGLARVAVDAVLRHLGSAAPTLVASAFAEIQGRLGRAVQQLWARQAAATGSTAHRYIASDVWDLFRSQAGRTPLHDFVEHLPLHTTVLLVAGPPCQDLTSMSVHAGKRGLCGDRSCNFYAVPLAAWCMQKLRPDLRIHTVVENAGSMKPIFKKEFLRALNVHNDQFAQLLDSAQWSVFPRRRYFFSTLPPDDPRRCPGARRSRPWDEGWAPRQDGEIPPMLCSRTPPGPDIRASTRHYHPKHLLYRHDSRHVWHGGDWTRVHRYMASLVPGHLKEAFAALLTGPRREKEQEALPAVDWIEEEGRQHGFRIPTAAERAKATGQEDYLGRLRQSEGAGFTDRDLFDWTGNHFDPDALALRIRVALAAGAGARPHTYHDPPTVLAGYVALRNHVASDGTQVQRQPVPMDLFYAFQHATDAAAATTGPHCGPPSADLDCPAPGPPAPLGVSDADL